MLFWDYYKQEREVEARSCLEDVQLLCSRIKIRERSAKIEILLKLFHELNQFDDTKRLARSYQRQAENLGAVPLSNQFNIVDYLIEAGKIEDARHYLERLSEVDHPATGGKILQHLSLHKRFLKINSPEEAKGHFLLAKGAFESLRKDSRPGWRHEMINFIEPLLRWGSKEDAKDMVTQIGRSATTQEYKKIWEANACREFARSLARQGEMEEAKEFLKNRGISLTEDVQLAFVEEYCLQGELVKAAMEAEGIVDSSYYKALAYLALVRSHLAKGDFSEALRFLEGSLRSTSSEDYRLNFRIHRGILSLMSFPQTLAFAQKVQGDIERMITQEVSKQRVTRSEAAIRISQQLAIARLTNIVPPTYDAPNPMLFVGEMTIDRQL